MADMKLPEFDITLIIKAPNQKICDQKIKCETQWTVKQLKQHLSQVYPSQPNESQQRIIYSGRLLHDHLTLKEILKHGADVHTMHLVCPPEKSSATSDQSSQSRNDSSKVSDTKSQGASIVSSLSEEELRTMYSEYYVYLYQWYQQQMFQYFSNPRVDAPPTESQPSQPPSEAQNPPPRNEARPAPPVQAAAIAAGPGGIAGEFDDENFERDWLDWFYYALRVAILIGLLNYYSSWSKILTAVCIIGIFTMYRFMFQRRNRPAEPQAPQRQQQQQAPQQEQQQAPANDAAERERPAEASEGAENREAGSNGGDVATEPVAAGQVSLFRKIVNSFYLFSQFCVTLITSLVPERVPPLDLD